MQQHTSDTATLSRPTTTAISAQAYEQLRHELLKTEHEAHAEQPAQGLAPTDSQCRSIETLCAGLSVAILEVFAGRRPVGHIAKWLNKDCTQKISARARLTNLEMKKRYANVPVNYSPFSRKLRLPHAKRVRAQRVSEDVFEVTIVMQDFSRARAMAMRVEKIFSTWKITAIEIA